MAEKMALHGLKVLEWGNTQAVPAGAKCLADFGAQVIKVESARFPDLTRVALPLVKGVPPPENSTSFSHLNTSKMSITLNLTKPKGVELFKRIAAWADVVVQNQKPGAIRKVGLGYEELRKVKPDIIMVNASLRGQEGPGVGVGGWGHNSSATAGHTYLTRFPGGNPSNPGRNAPADVLAYLLVVIATLAAVDYRRRTGKGQCIDVAQIEPLVHFLGTGILDYRVNGRIQEPVGNRDPHACPHAAFRCKGDDEWCAIAVFAEGEWEALCRVAGHREWTTDPRFASLAARKRNEDELESLIGSWTADHSPEEVMALLQEAGVAAGVVQNVDDIMERDLQVRERRVYRKVRHPLIGEFYHSGWPFVLSETPYELRHAPLMGQDNEYVFSKILNMSKDEIAELMQEGVIA